MWIVIAGWLSAVLVFASFFMKTMIPLRMVAICSNIAFITYALLGLQYGVFGRVYPILVLHSALLPLNLVRLRQLKGLLRAVHQASEDETIRSLVPYMQTETHAAGDVLFEKGDPANRLYVIEHGHVKFPEIGKVVSAGQVFGEVGLFAPQNVRALSAVCDEDCRLYTITREKVLELYYQNPKFGFFLIRLVAGLVLENQRAGAAAARA
jgi:CRP/FNR family transcriptional regulator, cyclic AMP receptor protein